MKQSVRKVWNIVSTVLVVLVVLLAVALVGVRLVGIRTYAVISGSMEPTYPTGSLLYVKSADASELQVGDAITFMVDEDTVATHRIIEILPDEEDSSVLRFRTQGDANDAADLDLVPPQAVVGKVVHVWHGGGRLVRLLRSPLTLLLGLVVLIAVIEIPYLFGKKTAEK